MFKTLHFQIMPQLPLSNRYNQTLCWKSLSWDFLVGHLCFWFDIKTVYSYDSDSKNFNGFLILSTKVSCRFSNYLRPFLHNRTNAALTLNLGYMKDDCVYLIRVKFLSLYVEFQWAYVEHFNFLWWFWFYLLSLLETAS